MEETKDAETAGKEQLHEAFDELMVELVRSIVREETKELRAQVTEATEHIRTLELGLFLTSFAAREWPRMLGAAGTLAQHMVKAEADGYNALDSEAMKMLTAAGIQLPYSEDLKSRVWRIQGSWETLALGKCAAKTLDGAP